MILLVFITFRTIVRYQIQIFNNGQPGADTVIKEFLLILATLSSFRVAKASSNHNYIIISIRFIRLKMYPIHFYDTSPDTIQMLFFVNICQKFEKSSRYRKRYLIILMMKGKKIRSFWPGSPQLPEVNCDFLEADIQISVLINVARLEK